MKEQDMILLYGKLKEIFLMLKLLSNNARNNKKEIKLKNAPRNIGMRLNSTEKK